MGSNPTASSTLKGGLMESVSRTRVARNFIKRRGRGALASLLESFHDNKSGQKIADELGVSRERVRQWRGTFGETITTYRVFPEIREVLK